MTVTAPVSSVAEVTRPWSSYCVPTVVVRGAGLAVRPLLLVAAELVSDAVFVRAQFAGSRFGKVTATGYVIAWVWARTGCWLPGAATPTVRCTRRCRAS